jgi:hypothetical protein
MAMVAADFSGTVLALEVEADLLGFGRVVIDCGGKPKAPL